MKDVTIQNAISSQEVFANQSTFYEGTGNFYFNMATATDSRQGVFNASYVSLEITDHYDKLFFTDGVESHDIKIDKTNGYYITNYNGVDYSYLGDIGWDVFDFLFTGGGTKISYGNENEYFYIDMVMNLETAPPDHDVYAISSPFAGTAESDDSRYTVSLAGYYTADLPDGTHTLSASDISSQTIAIVAFNKNNQVKRVMRETTIEEMSVTVSGGIITEYIIRGRVQTDGGTLDRYTAVINP